MSLNDDLKPMPDEIWAQSHEHPDSKDVQIIASYLYPRPGLTKYVRADTIPAPEKIDGVQAAMECLITLKNGCDTYGVPEQGKRDHLIETIKRALIQAGAKA